MHYSKTTLSAEHERAFFDALCHAFFMPQERKQLDAVDLEDGTVMRFAVYSDFVVLARISRANPISVDVRDMWLVPKTANQSTELEDTFLEEC